MEAVKTEESWCFYALGIGLSFATSSRLQRLMASSVRFLCPRHRAELCDGCSLEVPVTCTFAGRCANLQTIVPQNGLNRLLPRRQARDLHVPARQPRPSGPVSGHPCTGSYHDPEVLPLFDDSRTEYGHLADRAFIEWVHAHLVLDRVDELPQFRLEGSTVTTSTQVAFEDA
jgi:hypothetical protein